MRYIPHTEDEIQEMLQSIGISSIDSLFSDIPQHKRIAQLNLLPGKSEWETAGILKELSDSNRFFQNSPGFLGAGIYRHYTPAVVDSILSRSEFYTAYTPYQAEASQGILQSIFEYQTMICMLTGMDVSNASHYDGSTACAEAALMALSQSKNGKIFYSGALHPEYVQVMETYLGEKAKDVLIEIPLKNGVTDQEFLEKNLSKDTAGVILQNPNCLGFIEPAENIGGIIKNAKIKGYYIAVVTEAHSLGILKKPGEWGADIAVGEGTGLGIPPSFGGPGLGFMAVKSKHTRKLPGRLAGKTTDHEGNTAYCLTLQTREQHIRREKASSNICTNQALCALASTVYLALLGKTGFRETALRCLEKAHYLKDKLLAAGFSLYSESPFFNEFAVICPDDPVKIERFLRNKGITSGFKGGLWKPQWKDIMIFCATEVNTKQEIDRMIGFLETYCKKEVSAACVRN